MLVVAVRQKAANSRCCNREGIARHMFSRARTNDTSDSFVSYRCSFLLRQQLMLARVNTYAGAFFSQE